MLAIAHLVTELQSFGLRIEKKIFRRSGGAGPAEGGSLLIDGRPVSVPVGSPFVERSAFTLVEIEKVWWICRDGNQIIPAEPIKSPGFYRERTAEGIPFQKIALLHGQDCLATTINQRCLNWEQDRPCRFCGIELSFRMRSTVPRKTPEQLAEVSSHARELDGIRHVVLTTGTCGTPEIDIGHLARCTAAIKKTSGLPVHVQCLPPRDTCVLERLKEAGVDTIGLHIESFDEAVLAEAAPAKAAIGLAAYRRAWKEAVAVFGSNQVSSFIIAGLGEEKESILTGGAMLADLGVYPFIVPLRPIPGSLMEKALPPDPAYLFGIYEAVAGILANRGLHYQRSLAGCVRCGACSALSFYEEAPESVVCRPVRTPGERAEAAAIRRRVFVDEQGLFADSDADENDAISIHLVAEQDGRIIGTVRVFPLENNGHWIGGRLAVRQEVRSGGAGERLVREAVALVKRKGCNCFSATIQQENVPFFNRLGWKAVGPIFEYRGRNHQRMEADLSRD